MPPAERRSKKWQCPIKQNNALVVWPGLVDCSASTEIRLHPQMKKESVPTRRIKGDVVKMKSR